MTLGSGSVYVNSKISSSATRYTLRRVTGYRKYNEALVFLYFCNFFEHSRQAMGEGDDSDGPASLESECSDSLTELRSKTKRGSKSNDEDEDDDEDEISEDEDQFADSWESFAIYDGD